MNDRNEQAQYFIERIRSVANSTSRLGLLFLFTLLYIWFSSIEPNFQLLRNMLTDKDKSAYFENLTKKINRSKIFRQEQLIRQENQPLSRYNLEPNSNKIFANKTKNRINNLDSLLSYSTKIKNRYIHSSDSLIKSIKVNIDVPTLKPVTFDIRNGTLFWMFLMCCFLSFILYNRYVLANYVKLFFDIVYHELKLPKNKYQEFDPQIPFWFVPISMHGKEEEEKEALRSIINYKYYAVYSLLTVILIVILLYFQFRVAWLSWNINSIELYKDQFFLYKFLTILLLFITTIVAVLWFKPVKISTAASKSNHISIDRREFIRYALPGILFLVLIPKVSNSIPIINSDTFNYKRTKKRIKKDNLSTLAHGFYIHVSDKKNVIHYVSHENKCLSLKTIAVPLRSSFEKSLKKVDVFQLVKEADFIELLNNPYSKNKFSFPFSDWAIENEAITLLKINQVNKALELLIIGLQLNLDTYKVKRLSRLFCGILIKYRSYINIVEFKKYRKEFNKLRALERNTGKDELSLEMALKSSNDKKSSFYKKWKNSTEIPWSISSRILSKIPPI